MGVLVKRVVKNEGLRLRKKQEPTQHVVSAYVFDDVGTSSLIPGCNAEVMVAKTLILSQIGLSSRKGKQAGFPVITNFVGL